MRERSPEQFLTHETPEQVELRSHLSQEEVDKCEELLEEAAKKHEELAHDEDAVYRVEFYNSEELELEVETEMLRYSEKAPDELVEAFSRLHREAYDGINSLDDEV